jgi:predicted DNA-binding transcriptional regulator YafY
MNRSERLYIIDQMLGTGRAVPIEEFLARLEVSPATFKRDLEYLRDRLQAPIVWNQTARGYLFGQASGVGPRYELPGLWFSAKELFALLAAQKILADIEPGVLAAHVAPLQSRLSSLLETSGHSSAEVSRRVRLLSMAKRPIEPRYFADIAWALFCRQQIKVDHWHRKRDDIVTRTLSPQRLVHYRDNWYLDAWCHLRNELRSFAAETLLRVTVVPEVAKEIADETLDAHYATAYGIFAGAPTETASLLFSAERARWVRHETWHSEQRGEDLPDGRYRLQVPYSDERELLMDIMRHGAHILVEKPFGLRRRLQEELHAINLQYSAG